MVRELAVTIGNRTGRIGRCNGTVSTRGSMESDAETFIANYFFRFLDMHMYITSALQKSDMKAVGLQLALDLLHEKVISASKASTDVTFAAFKLKMFRCSAGKARSDNWIEDPNQCRTPELGQSIQTNSSTKEGKSYRFLLRATAIGQNAASEM